MKGPIARCHVVGCIGRFKFTREFSDAGVHKKAFGRLPKTAIALGPLRPTPAPTAAGLPVMKVLSLRGGARFRPYRPAMLRDEHSAIRPRGSWPPSSILPFHLAFVPTLQEQVR